MQSAISDNPTGMKVSMFREVFLLTLTEINKVGKIRETCLYNLKQFNTKNDIL